MFPMSFISNLDCDQTDMIYTLEEIKDHTFIFESEDNFESCEKAEEYCVQGHAD